MSRIIAVVVGCVILVTLASGTVRADQLIIPVLGESWFITAETPAIDAYQGERRDDAYHYQALSTKGFNISCFVEKPANDKAGHEACMEHYWPKMKRNPMIDQNSVESTKQANFCKVSYDTTGEPAMHHANYYVSHEGRWLDVHVSMLTTLPSEKIFKAFDDSLQIRTMGAVKADGVGAGNH